MHRRAFSLIEMLAVVAIAAVLLSLLLPALSAARDVSRRTICAANLRQIGIAWHAYANDHAVYPHTPDHAVSPDWAYGGAASTHTKSLALDPNRPINQYLASAAAQSEQATGPIANPDTRSTSLALLFRCPADVGIFLSHHDRVTGARSILQAETCFAQFGTSYRANPALIDARHAGLDSQPRPLRIAEITASPSTLLAIADPAWYFASRDETDPDHKLDASWHTARDAGNFLAADGSVRWFDLTRGTNDFTDHPVAGK